MWSSPAACLPKTPCVCPVAHRYENPFATIYRAMAILGTEGFGSLPKYCTLLMGCFFLAAIIICIIR